MIMKTASSVQDWTSDASITFVSMLTIHPAIALIRKQLIYTQLSEDYSVTSTTVILATSKIVPFQFSSQLL